MLQRFPLLITALLSPLASAQTINIETTDYDVTGRFGVTANADADVVLSLMMYDDNTLATSDKTPVDMALLESGSSSDLTELNPSGLPRSFYVVESSDLDTHELDTDGDGIKDRTELQAKPFVHPIDGTDAGNVDLFDITTTASISDGVPGIGAGNIESSNSADIYRFSGTAGDGVFIDITGHNSSLTLHDYKLIDKYGHVVKSARFGLSDMGPVTLPYDGEYILLFGDTQETGTGTYSFSISVIPAPQSFDIAIGDMVSDGVPDTGAGNIELAGAFDLYSFEGTAGQSVFVNILSHSGLTLLDYRLITPDGTELASSAFGISEIASVELPQTGTYTFGVGEATAANTGTYSFQITNIPPPDTFAIAIGDIVSDGVPGPGAGNIESPGVFDEYTFTGSAGQSVFFNVLSHTGLTLLDYKLIAPDESVVASSAFGISEIATVELPQAGTYTVRVGEAAADATGTYSFQITNIPPPDTFAIAIGDTVSDGVPGAGAGNIEVPGAFDEYSFSGTAGQSIFFNVLSHSGLTLLDYKLIGPDDSVVDSSAFGISEIGTVELPLTGTYTIEVGEAALANTGTYSFQITDIPAPDSFAIAIGDTVSDGVPGAGAGNIEVPGAFDEYTFTGTAGQSVFVDILSFSGVNTINYRLIAPDASILGNRSLSASDLATVELPLNGTYTLEVGEAPNDSTGTYSFAITNIPAPDSFAISIGDTISDGVPGVGAGNIETPGAYDEYTFSGLARETVNINMLSFSGVNTINYRLIAPDGTVLGNKQFNQGDIGFVLLPQSGTYVIEVGESTNASVGTYSIAVEAGSDS